MKTKRRISASARAVAMADLVSGVVLGGECGWERLTDEQWKQYEQRVSDKLRAKPEPLPPTATSVDVEAHIARRQHENAKDKDLRDAARGPKIERRILASPSLKDIAKEVQRELDKEDNPEFGPTELSHSKPDPVEECRRWASREIKRYKEDVAWWQGEAGRLKKIVEAKGNAAEIERLTEIAQHCTLCLMLESMWIPGFTKRRLSEAAQCLMDGTTPTPNPSERCPSCGGMHLDCKGKGAEKVPLNPPGLVPEPDRRPLFDEWLARLDRGQPDWEKRLARDAYDMGCRHGREIACRVEARQDQMLRCGYWCLVVGTVEVARESDACSQPGYPKQWTKESLKMAAAQATPQATERERALADAARRMLLLEARRLDDRMTARGGPNESLGGLDPNLALEKLLAGTGCKCAGCEGLRDALRKGA